MIGNHNQINISMTIHYSLHIMRHQNQPVKFEESNLLLKNINYKLFWISIDPETDMKTVIEMEF